MFDLMPFGRKDSSLFDAFDGFDSKLFKELNKAMIECKTDILDRGDKYVLQAELPGFEKEDIHIDISGNTLTVSAEHTEDSTTEKPHYVRRERRYGGYYRNFDITNVKADEVSAIYKQGVLELTLPKRAAAKTDGNRRIEIK